NRKARVSRLVVAQFEAKLDPAAEGDKAAARRGKAALQQDLYSLAPDEATRAALQPVLDAFGGKRERQVDAIRSARKGLLDRVASLDQDRLLPTFIRCIAAAPPTSYYLDHPQGGTRVDARGDGVRADGGPADYIAFKLDAARVPDAPKPRPYREIWVCGPRVEGVHLRFGPVARGGLRWSDRRE